MIPVFTETNESLGFRTNASRTHSIHLGSDVENVGQQEGHETRLPRLLQQRRQDLPSPHLLAEPRQDSDEALQEARLRFAALRCERVAFQESKCADEETGEVRMGEEGRGGESRGGVASDELGEDRLDFLGEFAPCRSNHTAGESFLNLSACGGHGGVVGEGRTSLGVNRVEDAPKGVEII